MERLKLGSCRKCRDDVSCYRCEGSGRKDCYKCDSTGNIVFDRDCWCSRNREGKSRKDCEKCSGSGRWYEIVKCHRCENRGYFDCTKCDGRGVFPCNLCGRGTNEPTALQGTPPQPGGCDQPLRSGRIRAGGQAVEGAR